MRVATLALVGALAAAGCTNYVPIPQGEGSWEEARRAAYGDRRSAVASAAPAPEMRRDTPARAATSSSDRVVRDAPMVDPLEPKPLPPLRTTSARTDAPVSAAPRDAAPERRAARTETTSDTPTPAQTPRAEPAAVAREDRVTATAAPAEPAPSRDAEASLPPPALSGVGFLWPVPAAGDTATVTDVGGEGALAVEAPAGEAFVAAENGVVVFAGDDLEAFGRMVVVRHDGDYTTAYGHAERLDVAVGDVVRRGQKLGLIGTSGEVATPQLYFEMRIGSRVVDPRAYLVEAPRLVAAR